MKKELMSLLMALTLCGGLALPGAALETEPAGGQETATPFADVAEGDYFYKPVEWAVERGITSGTTQTTFSPDLACTRGQIAVFLWRAAGSPEPRLTEQQFVDVADRTAYYYKAVQWAAEMDMEYYGEFRPHDVCGRLEAVYFMWRAAGSPEMEGEMPFTDVTWEETEDGGQPRYLQAKDAVLWAVENGVTQGTTETTFSPDASCTRGQIAAFLYRAFGAETQPGG